MRISGSENSEKRKENAMREFLWAHRGWRHGYCWEWPRLTTEKGYGIIRCAGRIFSVHRLSFEFYKGIIPLGFEVMHACDNPPCFRPDHLFLGTHQENMDDMRRKGRARNGHA